MPGRAQLLSGRHGAPPLALDDAAIAQAMQCAQSAWTLDGLSTPPGPGPKGYGENRYWFATCENGPASCAEAVKRCYEAGWTGGYDWDRPGYSPDTASFTQVAWKDTDALGGGRASGHREGGESHQTFIVCSYAPRGQHHRPVQGQRGEADRRLNPVDPSRGPAPCHTARALSGAGEC
ncbi:CAP domain-containing protein [Streptomyces tibetensis]|uniref:CAP domain-containing protein n=1 Tax=Streptomyces tibetensis TaxID=2382123 RepID=UPI0033C4F00D